MSKSLNDLEIYRDLETLRKRLNAYIKSIGPQSDTHDS